VIFMLLQMGFIKYCFGNSPIFLPLLLSYNILLFYKRPKSSLKVGAYIHSCCVSKCFENVMCFVHINWLIYLLDIDWTYSICQPTLFAVSF
jgi:hypothetical protein